MSSETVGNMVKVFRDRARRLRMMANFVLALVAVSLGGGIYIFVIAGKIASEETRTAINAFTREVRVSTEKFEELQIPQVVQTVHALTSNMSRLTETFDRVLFEIEPEIAKSIGEGLEVTPQVLANVVGPELVQDTLKSLHETSLAATQLFTAYGALSRVVLEKLKPVDLPKAIDEFLKPISAAVVNNLTNAEYQALRPEQETTFIISTLSTRVGSLLILIFLVQILVNLYRYNIRLSAYYDARADAFELHQAGGDESPIGDLIRALSPENMDFGKTPQSPAQHAIDLAREVIAREKT